MIAVTVISQSEAQNNMTIDPDLYPAAMMIMRCHIQRGS